MNNFLGKYNLPKLATEEIQCLNIHFHRGNTECGQAYHLLLLGKKL